MFAMVALGTLALARHTHARVNRVSIEREASAQMGLRSSTSYVDR
jgi:hypothetical protein